VRNVLRPDDLLPVTGTPEPTPTLSVVVTVVDGGAALERCLTALASQEGAPSLEVLVPCDATASAAAALALGHPGVRVLDLGVVPTRHTPGSPAGQHELYDRRRAAGLARARGELIAIVEDRGVPHPAWARTFARLHAGLPNAVIGGAVASGRPALLNRAVFLCDFGRYEPPFEAQARDYVTDVNVCYKRAALDRTRDLWLDRYHETTVHWALRRAGETLWLSPEPVVRQMRDDLALGTLIGERFAWGRLFAATRARESSLPARLARAAASPLLPLVMWWRIVRRSGSGRGGGGSVVVATPAILLLLAAWAAGEMAGYLTARA
jgi:hypothetical protein